MKLFVDDERPAPEGWTLIKTSLETIALMHQLRERGETLEALSLDHDLGTRMETYEDETSRPIMLWMCQHDWWPRQLYIHTANSVGQEWLVGMARRYAPAGTLRGYGANYWGTSPDEDTERHAA
ncbi:cyclic-phosphate processing receiver domain-containing protein [Nocardia africana]